MREIRVTESLYRALRRYHRYTNNRENNGYDFYRYEEVGCDELLREYFTRDLPLKKKYNLVPKRNAFIALCELASKEEWCWNLMCTTCGLQDLRLSFKEIIRGNHPDSENWIMHKYGYETVNRYESYISWLHGIEWSLESQIKLAEIFATASLKQISKLARFPDWLGYMGVVLSSTEEEEKKSRTLTKAWAPQLLEMVEPESYAKERLLEMMADETLILRWGFLESVENSLKPSFRNRSVN